MASWQLEIFRMVIYMGFPVGLFHYFNQPEVYENWVVKKNREIYPMIDREEDNKLRATIREIRERQEEKLQQEMENDLLK